MTYKFASGFQLRTKPQLVGEFLAAIEERHNEITPELVLKAAKNPEAPIHDEFEWDDELAANKWRLNQAGYILRAVVAVTVVNGEEKTVRAFVNIEKGDGYHSIANVMESPEDRAKLLGKALEELRAWRERYARYKELTYLCSIVGRNLRPFEEKILNRVPQSVSVSAQA